jgi:hypothetical protein
MGSQVVSDYSLDFHGVCCYLPFCISDFTDFDFFSLHFSQVCQGSVNLVNFFKELSFCFTDSLYFCCCCFYIINFLLYFLLFLSFCLFWVLLVLVFRGL